MSKQTSLMITPLGSFFSYRLPAQLLGRNLASNCSDLDIRSQKHLGYVTWFGCKRSDIEAHTSSPSRLTPAHQVLEERHNGRFDGSQTDLN
jgi:hypothetical protein